MRLIRSAFKFGLSSDLTLILTFHFLVQNVLSQAESSSLHVSITRDYGVVNSEEVQPEEPQGLCAQHPLDERDPDAEQFADIAGGAPVAMDASFGQGRQTHPSRESHIA